MITVPRILVLQEQKKKSSDPDRCRLTEVTTVNTLEVPREKMSRVVGLGSGNKEGGEGKVDSQPRDLDNSTDGDNIP